nr:glycosyltransferase family 1 protein [Gemmatimonadaceae bacterium]
MSNAPLKLFYAEPEFDRWFPFDRYPRRAIRRLVRGAPQIGGVQRWFVNLCLGLDELGVAYDVND